MCVCGSDTRRARARSDGESRMRGMKCVTRRGGLYLRTCSRLLPDNFVKYTRINAEKVAMAKRSVKARPVDVEEAIPN